MDVPGTRFVATATGDVAVDWRRMPGSGGPYAACRIGGPGVDGGLLCLPPGFPGRLAARAGHEGWRWSGAAWPDRFHLDPVAGFDRAVPASVEEWYTAPAFVARAHAPAPRAAGDRVWRIARGADEIGFLVRSPRVLRWEVRRAFVGDGRLPDGRLEFVVHPWPLAADGEWDGATAVRAADRDDGAARDKGDREER